MTTTSARVLGIALLAAVLFGLGACVHTPPQVAAKGTPNPWATVTHARIRLPPGSMVFRANGTTSTDYMIFLPDRTCSFLAREHVGTIELDHGTWTRAESGEMTLTSRVEPDKITHVTVVEYKSWVALVSPDYDFINIAGASRQELQRYLDLVGSDADPPLVFLRMRSEDAAAEANTTQPFVVYTELNKCFAGEHGVGLKKGSPLTPKEPVDNAME